MKDGVALVDDGRIQGVNEHTLTISDVSKDDEGSYECVVSYTYGNIISTAVVLSVGKPA